MPYPWLPPRGKPGKKAAFPPHCGDETTTNYKQSLLYSEHANNTTLLYHYSLGELPIKAFVDSLFRTPKKEISPSS